MSTKAEQESSPVERAADHVDPPAASTILEAPVAETREMTGEVNGGGNGPEAPDTLSVPGAATSNEPLSTDDADRFAANFRASWEPPTPAAAAVRAVQAAPSIPTRPVSSPVLPAEPEADLDVSIVPGARERKRAMMMTVGAVAGFVLLGIMALMSSRSAPPAHAPRAEAKTEPAAPSQAAAPPAPPPAPAPVAPEPVALPHQPQVAEAPPTVPPSEPSPPPGMAALAGPAPALAAPATPPAQPDLVRIQLRATPIEAQLELDDAKISNPYDSRAPKGGKHLLRVNADGYHSREITLRFDHDREITVELDKRKVPKPSPKPRATPPPPPVAPAHAAKLRVVPSPEPRAQPAAPRAKKGAGFVSESPY